MPGAIAEGWGEGGSFLMHALHTNKATLPFPLVNGASFTKDGMGVGRSPRMHYTQTKPHSPSPALIPIPSPGGPSPFTLVSEASFTRERGSWSESIFRSERAERAGARPVHFGKDGGKTAPAFPALPPSLAVGMGVGRSACGAASA